MAVHSGVVGAGIGANGLRSIKYGVDLCMISVLVAGHGESAVGPPWTSSDPKGAAASTAAAEVSGATEVGGVRID